MEFKFNFSTNIRYNSVVDPILRSAATSRSTIQFSCHSTFLQTTLSSTLLTYVQHSASPFVGVSWELRLQRLGSSTIFRIESHPTTATADCHSTAFRYLKVDLSFLVSSYEGHKRFSSSPLLYVHSQPSIFHCTFLDHFMGNSSLLFLPHSPTIHHPSRLLSTIRL